MDTQKKILSEINEQTDLIKSLCTYGVCDEDRYDKICKIIDLFMRVNELTKNQVATLEILVSITGDYQEKHFSYGN